MRKWQYDAYNKILLYIYSYLSIYLSIYLSVYNFNIYNIHTGQQPLPKRTDVRELPTSV